MLLVRGDLHAYDVAGLEAPFRRHVADAVDVGGVRLRAADGDAVLIGLFVDDDVLDLPDAAGKLL